MNTTRRYGSVAFLGKSNAGKSTLLNALLGEELAIVTHKVQTTRMRIPGILTHNAAQILCIDTPGVFRGSTGMDKAMATEAIAALEDTDIALLIADASLRDPLDALGPLFKLLKTRRGSNWLILNKVDKIKDKSRLLEISQRFFEALDFDKVMMISALSGSGIEDVKSALASAMPLGEWAYPEDQLSTIPLAIQAAELTREQILLQLHQELPYGCTVIPESWENRPDGSASIHQQIVVSQQRHKGIILGKQGSKLKAIGEAARGRMRDLFGFDAHLFLHVKIDPKWSERDHMHRLMGISE